MDKLGRNYSLTVGTNDGGSITIKPPLTIEFDITRNILSSANVSSIRIFNLSLNRRNLIRKNINDFFDQRTITLHAGYGSNTPIVFNGDITQAWSTREGTNMITQIESFDGGFAFANNRTEMNFAANIPQQSVIDTLVSGLKSSGVKPGVIGSFPAPQKPRGQAYSGNTTAILKELTGGAFFIDNGKAFALGETDCIAPGEISLIDTTVGLLNTPVLEQTILNFDMIFEPKLLLAQLITLKSVTESILNNVYKVVSIKHRGMISAAVCGSAITSVGLFRPLGKEELSVVGAA